MSYFEKYVKYKNKYLKLKYKNQRGGRGNDLYENLYKTMTSEQKFD